MIAILKELKQMWSSCSLKLFLSIIIILFTQKVFADTLELGEASSMSFKRLDKIEEQLKKKILI